MNSVSPIYLSSVSALRRELYRIHPRYALAFDIGLETGLRISDILNLKAGDFSKRNFCVIENKTKKKRSITLSSGLFRQIKIFIDQTGLDGSDYLIYSSADLSSKPLSRFQAYKTIKRVSEKLGIANISPHSMRKTYARSTFNSTKDLVKLKVRLNHANMATTLLYLLDLNKPLE